MDKGELLKLAGQYFIADTGSSVANLVRKIQLAEGHVDCFATGRTRCDQMGCRWRAECLSDPAPEPEVVVGSEPEMAAGAVDNQREKAK